jgi:hypothetical protein
MASLIPTAQSGPRRNVDPFLRSVWSLTRPLLVVLLVVALIDALPLSAAGISPTSLLKATIALPAGFGIVYGAGRRQAVGLLLFVLYFALMVALIAAGIPQGDGACDTAVLSMFAVTAWMIAPYVFSKQFRSGAQSATAFGAVGQSASRGLERVVTRLSGRWWVTRAEWTLRTMLILVAGLAAAAVLLTLAIVARRLDVPSALRLLEIIVDGAIGACAIWFVGRRFGGAVAGTGAAILWACCGLRLDYAAVHSEVLAPTCVVPLLVALGLALRDNDRSRNLLWPVTLASIVPLAFVWPAVTLTIWIALIFAFWSAGYVREARLAFAGLIGTVVVAGVVAPGMVLAHLGAQTGMYDPADAIDACDSGCDGGLPWEFFYPSAFGAVYAAFLAGLLTGSVHWGNVQVYSIAPGWAQLALATVGAASLYLGGRGRLANLWLGAIVVGVLLALPSHYLGLALPSLTRILVALSPTFEFGAQFALVSGFFVAILGGIGLTTILASAPKLRVVLVGAAAVFVLLDVVSFPIYGHPGSALATISKAIPPSPVPPKVVFYPYLSQEYGPEFEDLVLVAHRQGLSLLNEHPSDADLDISAPDARAKLATLGIQYVVVSLGDYTRRREMLQEAHVLLPLAARAAAPAWMAPEPNKLLGFRVLESESDGTLLLTP